MISNKFRAQDNDENANISSVISETKDIEEEIKEEDEENEEENYENLKISEKDLKWEYQRYQTIIEKRKEQAGRRLRSERRISLVLKWIMITLLTIFGMSIFHYKENQKEYHQWWFGVKLCLRLKDKLKVISRLDSFYRNKLMLSCKRKEALFFIKTIERKCIGYPIHMKSGRIKKDDMTSWISFIMF